MRIDKYRKREGGGKENDPVPEIRTIKGAGRSRRSKGVVRQSRAENGFPRLRFREWIYSIANRRQEGSRRRHLIQ